MKVSEQSKWINGNLSDIADITMGQSPPGNSYNDLKNGIGLINGPTEFTNKYPVVKQWTSKPTKLCKAGDILLCVRGSSTGRMNIADDEYCIGRGVASIRAKKDKAETSFIYYTLNYKVNHLLQKTAGSTFPNLSSNEIKDMIVGIPLFTEQQKIASILSTWDKAIELKEKLIEQKKEQKKGLMQKLLTGEVRFPGYDGKWQKVDFEEVFIRIPVKKYQIKTTEYLKSGQFPVIDQGKQKIVAYSNNAEKVYQVESKGVIVFGDHTRERKFIDFDFIVGADGTQVLDTNDGYNNKFYFYCLLHQNIPNTGYNRHFKFLKEMWFFKPSLNEQVKIAEILSKIDKEIDLINKELEELKHQKQGLMQQLLTGKVRVKV